MLTRDKNLEVLSLFNDTSEIFLHWAIDVIYNFYYIDQYTVFYGSKS